MTKEEATTYIKEWLKDEYLDGKDRAALTAIIEESEQEPKYCDRNICIQNEYNGIGCDECEVTKSGESCVDAISRQYLLDNCVVDKVTMPYVPVGKIKNAPPVTAKQKTGHWNRVTDKAGHLVWECDCGWQQRFATNFCPDCGIKMEANNE